MGDHPNTETSARVPENIRFFLFTLFGAAALLWTAFLNGFPLIYYDTSSYLSGNDLGRAIGYNYFILITGLGMSLWPVVFAQALITSYLLMRVSCIMQKDDQGKELAAFAVLILVVLLTDISKYVSWLIPDIFASWFFLGTALFFLSPARYDRVSGAIVIALSLFCHASHIAIAILAVSFLCIAGLSFAKVFPVILRTAAILTAVVLVAFFLIIASNYYSGRGLRLFPPVKTSFLMAKFIDYSFVSDTLDKHCGSKRWWFCDYKDEIKSLAGKGSDFTLWSRHSPYLKMKTVENENDAKEIILYTLKSYFWKIAKYAALGTGKLLLNFDSPAYYADRDAVYPLVEKKYFGEYLYLLKSKQMTGRPAMVRLIPVSSHIFKSCIFTCIGLALALFIYKKEYFLGLFIISSFLFVLLNDLVMSSISTEWVSRYNMRVFWLIPYSLILTLFILVRKQFISRGWRLKLAR